MRASKRHDTIGTQPLAIRQKQDKTNGNSRRDTTKDKTKTRHSRQGKTKRGQRKGNSRQYKACDCCVSVCALSHKSHPDLHRLLLVHIRPDRDVCFVEQDGCEKGVGGEDLTRHVRRKQGG